MKLTVSKIKQILKEAADPDGLIIEAEDARQIAESVSTFPLDAEFVGDKWNPEWIIKGLILKIYKENKDDKDGGPGGIHTAVWKQTLEEEAPYMEHEALYEESTTTINSLTQAVKKALKIIARER
jgi:hypothetical protein